MASNYHPVIVDKIKEFHDQGIPPLFERELSLGELRTPVRGNLVEVLVGVRRCGKTYRLYQEMNRILDAGYGLDSILYFNFDDERLKPYETAMLDDVVESFFSLNPSAKTEGAFFFFDEIQEVPEWGAFMRRMVDTQNATIYLTGSSSQMLSTELASEFRGRALSHELFPMGFAEYLRYHGIMDAPSIETARNAPTSAARAKLRNALPNYLRQGGFIATQGLESSDAIQLLQEYANRTVNYDVIERYGVSNPQAAGLFLSRCIASSGRELSISKIHNEFRSRGISVGRQVLSQLLSYYEEAYLLFAVRNYSVSLADNPRSASKIYAVDPALFAAFSPAPSVDMGQRLETAVFNKLRRSLPTGRTGSIARAVVEHKGRRHEVDFVVGDALLGERPALVQVSVNINDPKTEAREFSSLEIAMEKFDTDKSVLVTLDDEQEVLTPSGTVHVIPAWKWLL